MSKDELIAKQQIAIENYKQNAREDKEIIRLIIGRFIGYGQPCNDNILQMNANQLNWCYITLELIDELNNK